MELKYGTKVSYGLGQIGEVIRTERKYRQDGVVVYEPGSAYSHWVPLNSVTVVDTRT